MEAKKGIATETNVRSVDARYFFIVLVPIAIFVCEFIISEHLMAADVNVPIDILREDNLWLETAGRSRFLAATWFFAALIVLAICLVARKLMQPMKPETRAAALATWFVVVVLALIPTIQRAIGEGGSPAYSKIGEAVFEAALSHGTLPGCASAEDTWLLGRCGDIPAVSLFERTMDIINLLAGLGIGALIVGMILCLDARRCESTEEQAALLSDNMRQMRQQLYLASLVLTFGIFFATSWMNWPVPLIEDSHKKAFEALVVSAALFTGTYFTLLLLGFFLPVAFLLSERARKLAMQVGDGTSEALDVEEWLASHGLKEGMGDYLRAGIALTAPIFTAFAGGVAPFPF